MARDEIRIDAPVPAVYEVLMDPFAYGRWVVGTRGVLGADGHWPKPGGSFRYFTGFGPLRFTDRTIMVDTDGKRRVELLARARPGPSAAITITLDADGGGTRLTLDERPAHRLLDLAMGPLGHAALSGRNRIALRRLKRIAESRA